MYKTLENGERKTPITFSTKLKKKKMGKCKNCQCDCHCDSPMHLPPDELDKGGACVCDNCECKNENYE